MMRIRVVSEAPEETVLGVSGWVYGDDAVVLEEECRRWLGQSKRLVLDLEETRIIDEDGIDVLTSFAGYRLVLKNASPFIQVLLAVWGLAAEGWGRREVNARG